MRQGWSESDLQRGFPWTGPGLAEFLSLSRTCLLGKIGFEQTTDTGPIVLAANTALATVLATSSPCPLLENLTVSSQRQWSACLRRRAHVREPAFMRLRFLPRRASGRSFPTSPVYHCLLTQDGEGGYWLLGEPNRQALTRRQRKVLALAYTDELTGLANRRRADRWLARLSAPDTDPGVVAMLIDVVGLKRVNETEGHAAGDALLTSFAATLKATLRATDRVARRGGDEFLVILSETDLARAVAVAARLRERLASARFEMPEMATFVPLRASIGVAALRAGEKSADWIGRADVAMRRAKAHGGDRVEVAG